MKKVTKRVISVVSVLLLVVSLFASSVLGNVGNSSVKAKAASTTETRNVMYYGDWSIWGGEGQFYPKDIPAEQLTHLTLRFLISIVVET